MDGDGVGEFVRGEESDGAEDIFFAAAEDGDEACIALDGDADIAVPQIARRRIGCDHDGDAGAREGTCRGSFSEAEAGEEFVDGFIAVGAFVDDGQDAKRIEG